MEKNKYLYIGVALQIVHDFTTFTLCTFSPLSVITFILVSTVSPHNASIKTKIKLAAADVSLPDQT